MNTAIQSTSQKNACMIEFHSYAQSVCEALDAIGSRSLIGDQKQILIKPNLVDSIPYPVTSHIDCVRQIIYYLRKHSNAHIIIGEGTGSGSRTTNDVFADLGYDSLAKELDVELIDLNDQPLVCLNDASCSFFPNYFIPRIAMESFILSTPVLKMHSLAIVTLALKNMMGFAPPSHYQKGGYWKKSRFHARMHQSITEMNRYRSADLILLDAVVGMAEYHMGGAQCQPPVNKLVAGISSSQVDKIGCELLGVDWRQVAHIRDSDC